ncbi:hypothetical protein EDC96DRAFT_544334 [Choanephora cucurbitarum]|nr:hypothetical protein EDC96DRAFT_544334 [Choanephora cucurbitarum]
MIRYIESTISCLVSDSNISIVDRWQLQYAGTILAPEEMPNKSPSSKRIPVTQSMFYDSPFVRKTASTKQLCTCCSKNLEQVSTRILEDNLVYCKECHLKLFSKGKCPTCRNPVSDTDDFIEYAKKIWHTQCFTCFDCKVPLEANPLVDLEDRPCCEPCFMNQAGKRSASRLGGRASVNSPEPYAFNGTSSTSTPSFQRSRLDHDLFQPKTPPLTRTPSPKEEMESELSADLLSRRQRTPHRLTSMFTPPPSLQTPERSTSAPSLEIIPTEKRPSSLSQRPCHACQLPLGNSSQKKVKIPLGSSQYAWFHKSCFVCSKCHQPFKNGECATDGHSFYHAQCDPFCSGCQGVIQQDSFQFNGKMYHFDCFKCFGRGCKLGFGQPIFEVNMKPYCEPCHTFFVEQKQTIPAPSSVKEAPSPLRQPLHRALPKLGGQKTCPRCQKNISIMDDAPGPFASRWHRKCLSCAKCSKQLDSDAKMKQGSQGESLVYCRSCIV